MSKKSIKQLFSLSLIAVALFGGVFDTSAHHAVIRVNLEEMTALAENVFMGRCINVEETRDMIAGGDLPVTRYTFEVERAIKGKMPKQITFTQIGHAPRRAIGKGDGLVSNGMRVKGGSFLHGASAYRVGDEVVLFLNPMSEGIEGEQPRRALSRRVLHLAHAERAKNAPQQHKQSGVVHDPLHGREADPVGSQGHLPRPRQSCRSRRGYRAADGFSGSKARVASA